MIEASALFVTSLIFGFSTGMREEWPLLLFHRGLVQRVSHLCSLDVTRPGGGATNHHGAQVVHMHKLVETNAQDFSSQLACLLSIHLLCAGKD